MRKREMIELIAGLREDLSRLQKRVTDNAIKHIELSTKVTQVKCEIDGHDFVFDKTQLVGRFKPIRYYFFKCSDCGFIQCNIKETLSQKEKTALKNLGLL